MIERVQRMVDEKAQLGERLGKLQSFLESDTINELPYQDVVLLKLQEEHMRNYFVVLQQRVLRATKP